MKAKDRLSGCTFRVIRILDNPTVLVRDDEGYNTYRRLNELDIRNQTIGMNDGVKVRLTKLGAELLNHEHIPVQEGTRMKDRWSAGDEYTAQLWWLMKVLGKYCSAVQDALFNHLQAV